MPTTEATAVSAVLEHQPDTSTRITDAGEDSRLAAGTFAQLCEPSGIKLSARENPVVVLCNAPPQRGHRLAPSPERVPVRKPSPVTDGIASPIKWEGGEHTFIGNHATLHFPGGDQPASNPLPLPNGLALSYGQIVALAGDFYGLVDEPISLDSNPPDRFLRAFHTLGADLAAKQEVPKILQIMQIEINAVNQALKEGREPSTAYQALGLEMDERYNVVTGGGVAIGPPNYLWLVPTGRYLKLADNDYDHFGSYAVTAYTIGHPTAINKALEGYRSQDPAQKLALLTLAYTYNAFADHFLTDIYSAGHMRTPRRELSLVCAVPEAGSYMAKLMHDEDNCWGLWVHNAVNEKWKAYGDKKLLDKANATNLKAVQKAIQASIDDIYTAFSSGTVTMPYKVLSYIPELDAVAKNAQRENPAGLFVKTQESNKIYIDRRRELDDRFDYTWIRNWDVAETYHSIPSSDTCGSKEIPFELNIDTLRLRNNGGPLGMTVLGPNQSGGYGPLWNSDNLHAGYGALAWLRVSDDLTTRIVQVWNSSGRLGLTTYGSDGGSGYKVVWSNTNMWGRSDALAWFACKAGVNQTNIVRVWDNNGLVGITTFRPDGGGSYKFAWNSDVLYAHAGAGATGWFKCRKGEDSTSIVQVYNSSGSVGMIAYEPEGDGYRFAWGNSNLGVPIDAVAWLTMEIDGQTYILQITDTSQIHPNKSINITIYSPDGNSGYTVRNQGWYDDPSGIWTTGRIGGQQCIVHLYQVNGVLASSYKFWPLNIGSAYEGMGIDWGTDPGTSGWVTLLRGDGDTMLVRYRNVNGNLGMALFEPHPEPGGTGEYQLVGRNDNLGIPADSIAFFGAEQILK